MQIKMKEKKIITEEIVSFETAKLAHEKGLTREMIGFKSSSVRKNYYTQEGELNGDCTKHIKELLDKNENPKHNLIPAPTQSIVQKFLRDECNIHISIEPLSEGEKPWFVNTIRNIKISEENRWWLEPSLTFATYEEALEYGIQEALKLL